MILNELFQHYFVDFKGKYLREKKRKEKDNTVKVNGV